MGRMAFDYLQKAGVTCDWLDLNELDLPLCDADACYDQPAAQKLSAAIEAADGLIVATPVYNYDVSAAAKNMIELTGSAWEDKVVGFLCAAGGRSSLMLDFRCVIIPRFVFAIGEEFDDGKLTDAKIVRRIEHVATELVRFTKALRG
jgi:FMN reductase